MKTFLFKDFDQENQTAIHIFHSTNHPIRSNPAVFRIHTHDYIEIVYVTAGSALELVNDERYEVRRGDLLFINYGATHAFQPHEPFSYINICFKPESLAENIITPENAFAVLQLTAIDELRRESDDNLISFNGGEREEIEEIVNTMLREYTERGPSWRTMLESYMNILIVRILRRVRFDTTDHSERDVWEELSDYIDANIDSIRARKCFYNPSYVSRVFKERFDMSLTEYINRRRIDYAIRLFHDTDLSGEEVAIRSGFSSKSSFYRIFTKITGRPPSDYRKHK